MTESQIFRQNLLRMMHEKGLKPAELSKLAGLNARAVKDIEENRVRSPKLSTVFALAQALSVDPGELMGLGKRPRVRESLAEYLSRYSEDEQERFLAALMAFPSPPASEK